MSLSSCLNAAQVLSRELADQRNLTPSQKAEISHHYKYTSEQTKDEIKQNTCNRERSFTNKYCKKGAVCFLEAFQMCLERTGREPVPEALSLGEQKLFETKKTFARRLAFSGEYVLTCAGLKHTLKVGELTTENFQQYYDEFSRRFPNEEWSPNRVVRQMIHECLNKEFPKILREKWFPYVLQGGTVAVYADVAYTLHPKDGEATFVLESQDLQETLAELVKDGQESEMCVPPDAQYIFIVNDEEEGPPNDPMSLQEEGDDDLGNDASGSILNDVISDDDYEDRNEVELDDLVGQQVADRGEGSQSDNQVTDTFDSLLPTQSSSLDLLVDLLAEEANDDDNEEAETSSQQEYDAAATKERQLEETFYDQQDPRKPTIHNHFLSFCAGNAHTGRYRICRIEVTVDGTEGGEACYKLQHVRAGCPLGGQVYMDGLRTATERQSMPTLWRSILALPVLVAEVCRSKCPPKATKTKLADIVEGLSVAFSRISTNLKEMPGFSIRCEQFVRVDYALVERDSTSQVPTSMLLAPPTIFRFERLAKEKIGEVLFRKT